MFKKKSKFNEEELIQERNSISLEEEQKELEEAETVVEDLEKEAAKLKEIEKEIQKTIKEAKASEKKENSQSVEEVKEETLEDVKKKNEELISQLQALESKVIRLETQAKFAEFEFKNKIQQLESKSSLKVKEIKEEVHKKMEEEKENIKKFSLQKFLESFISPFSNLKSAIDFGSDADNAAVSNYVKGFAMLYRQLEKVLESFGLEKIEPKKGAEFDSHFHSVYHVEDISNNETIIEVKSIGYKLHDRVIKPALVVVGKK
ncbi:nucleotide exchange factor GrpE [Mesomycoplasma hyorhinis]|uniref:nucleotide exchange factor GrpE n=1 Tax=Mesomycoplasma hyorhinis TaxID=2100 RepID=UPI001C03B07E|nr:nucleotide exchange factor GrpE [Mesomycoplasma hyorhinis]